MILIPEPLMQFIDKRPLIKVYSHPRSGTHLTEALLARNFYKHHNLLLKPFEWGHWSNRLLNTEGTPYGKLFGSHKFPQDISKKMLLYGIYVVRDPRAVALSVFKTPNFLHKKYQLLTFSDFLITPLDWVGSPANKTNNRLTIIEHWLAHTNAWSNYISNNERFLLVRYEDITSNPSEVVRVIAKKFQFLSVPKKIDAVSDVVGLLPNKAKADEWRNHFSRDDLKLVNSIIPKNNPFLMTESKSKNEKR